MNCIFLESESDLCPFNFHGRNEPGQKFRTQKLYFAKTSQNSTKFMIDNETKMLLFNIQYQNLVYYLVITLN